MVLALEKELREATPTNRGELTTLREAVRNNLQSFEQKLSVLSEEERRTAQRVYLSEVSELCLAIHCALIVSLGGKEIATTGTTVAAKEAATRGACYELMNLLKLNRFD